MSKGSFHSKEDWVEHSNLQRAMSLQIKFLSMKRGPYQFDPHNYFGGWHPADRESIETIKKDERLIEMMDYDSSSNCNSRGLLNSMTEESSVAASVAEE